MTAKPDLSARQAELAKVFPHWEKIGDCIDNFIDVFENYRQSGHPGGSRSKRHMLVALTLGGFMRWDIRHPEKRFGDRFVLAAGHTVPLIYATLGTLNNKDAAVFSTLIEAFTGSEANVLISTGKHFAADSFGTLPANIAVRPWVNQPEILRQAALFVSHGGLNSVHDSLYRGVPMLVVPQQAEQTLNGLRVAELGAGLLLKPGQFNADSVRSRAAQIMGDARFKTAAQRMGDTLRAAGGAVKAADEVEALLQNG